MTFSSSSCPRPVSAPPPRRLVYRRCPTGAYRAPGRAAGHLKQNRLGLGGTAGAKVQGRRRARWVDDGNIVTSSGVSAGIDMALSLIARFHGRDLALASARNMEYRWHEDAGTIPLPEGFI